MEIEEIKRLIIEALCDEYTIEEAIEQVNSSKITIEGDLVTVIYDNNQRDIFRIIVTTKLKLVS